MASKLLTEEKEHVDKWSRGHASRVKQGTQGMLAREHMSSLATLTLEYIAHKTCWHVRHLSTQGTLAGEQEST